MIINGNGGCSFLAAKAYIGYRWAYSESNISLLHRSAATWRWDAFIK